MKRLVLLLALLISASAFGQSLTELAKKEKERRKTNNKEAVVEVNQSDVAVDETPVSIAEGDDVETTGGETTTTKDKPEAEATSTGDEWSTIFKGFQARYRGKLRLSTTKTSRPSSR